MTPSLSTIRMNLSRIATVIVIACAPAASLLHAVDAWKKYSQRGPTDFLSLYEDRFIELKARLPPGVVLGYATDLARDAWGDEAVIYSVYYKAQYSLAPHILASDIDHDWVVGNFLEPANIKRTADENRLVLEHDFGRGVALYRRGGP